MRESPEAQALLDQIHLEQVAQLAELAELSRLHRESQAIRRRYNTRTRRVSILWDRLYAEYPADDSPGQQPTG